MKIQLLVCVGALLTLVSGCQTTKTPPATVEQQPRSYRSFAIVASPTDGPASDPTAPIRLAKPIEDSINSSLMSKGYTQASPAEADMLVKLSGGFTQEGVIAATERRSLLIEILDRRTSKQIWKNLIERSSSNTLPPELLQKEIAKRLATFPEASVMNH